MTSVHSRKIYDTKSKIFFCFHKLKKGRPFCSTSIPHHVAVFDLLAMESAKVDNKQVIFKGFVVGIPKETDMEVKVGKIDLKAPKGSGAILVKNLYLSCDPYMRGRMREFYGSYIQPFVPGQVDLDPCSFINIVYPT